MLLMCYLLTHQGWCIHFWKNPTFRSTEEQSHLLPCSSQCWYHFLRGQDTQMQNIKYSHTFQEHPSSFWCVKTAGRYPIYMLWEPFENGLVDPHDDITHVDTAAFCCWLAGKQLFNSHHAGAKGFVRDVLLSAKTKTQSWWVLQQAHRKHIICEDKNIMNEGVHTHTQCCFWKSN